MADEQDGPKQKHDVRDPKTNQFAPRPGSTPRPTPSKVDALRERAIRTLERAASKARPGSEEQARLLVKIIELRGVRPAVNPAEEAREVEARIQKQIREHFVQERAALRGSSDASLAIRAAASVTFFLGRVPTDERREALRAVLNVIENAIAPNAAQE
jgi:uncharacterized protein (DUF2267 family)